MKKLNIGCGELYEEGYINCDIRDDIKKDLYLDLTKFPYPFKNSEIDECYIHNVLPCIPNPLKVLKELIRITKKRGKIIFVETHSANYAITSSFLKTTCNFTENTFDNAEVEWMGLSHLIKRNNSSFVYDNPWKKYIPFKRYLKIFLNGMYDKVRIELEVIKKK